MFKSSGICSPGDKGREKLGGRGSERMMSKVDKTELEKTKLQTGLEKSFGEI